MRFDVTDLRLFIAVVKAGSITGGAARTNLALASASQCIRGMEATLGTALLARSRRGVGATAALARHARIVLGQLEHMRAELGQYARGLKAHVRLLSNTVRLSEFLPPVLAAFLPRHHHVDVELQELPSDEIARAVAAGRADIGIVADYVDMTGFETFPFRLDRLVLAVPRGHAFAQRRAIGFAETLGQEFVGLAAGSALQAHVARQARRASGRLQLRVRVAGFDALCRLVEQGVGLAVLPETAARRCRRTMRFRVLRLTDPWALRRLQVCVRRVDALPKHAQKLVEALRSGQPSAISRRLPTNG